MYGVEPSQKGEGNGYSGQVSGGFFDSSEVSAQKEEPRVTSHLPFGHDSAVESERNIGERSFRVEGGTAGSSARCLQFERNSAERLEDILSSFAEKASKVSDFNEKAYMQCLDIFRGKGMRNSGTTGIFILEEIPTYGVKGLIKDIAYVIDNYSSDSPYFDLDFFSTMIQKPLNYILDPSLLELKALACYIAGRFIMNIGRQVPLPCPQNLRDGFFMTIGCKADNPSIPPELRGVLRELVIQSVLHCEMPALRRVDLLRDLYRKNILVPQQSDPVKQAILSTFAAIGEEYRPVFGDMNIVRYARELLVRSVLGTHNSEALMAHWNILIGDLMEAIKSGKVDEDSRQGIGRCTQRLLSEEECPPHVRETLEALDRLCR
ncbi:MAG: hypothetical protein LBC11_01340 [Puniceicoccales bacterium]|jgi:hypothetical protein|nr:hypothetical protein [Puniceicoccales bacterium]